MKLIPQQYYLLVELHVLKPKSNIVRPEQVEQGLTYGIVLAVGDECKRTAKGEKVLFNPGNAIGMNELEQTAIVPEGAVFAKLELEEE